MANLALRSPASSSDEEMVSPIVPLPAISPPWYATHLFQIDSSNSYHEEPALFLVSSTLLSRPSYHHLLLTARYMPLSGRSPERSPRKASIVFDVERPVDSSLPPDSSSHGTIHSL